MGSALCPSPNPMEGKGSTLTFCALSATDECRGWKEVLGLNSWEDTDGVRNGKWLTAISTKDMCYLFWVVDVEDKANLSV